MSEIKDILDQWKIDSKLNVSDIANEGARIYDLHVKYLDLWSYAKASLKKLENEYRKLYLEAVDFYLHGPTKGHDKWTPEDYPGKIIIKANVDQYVKADKYVQRLQDIIDQAQIKADALESIMGVIRYRGNVIKTALEAIKWEGGS